MDGSFGAYILHRHDVQELGRGQKKVSGAKPCQVQYCICAPACPRGAPAAHAPANFLFWPRVAPALGQLHAPLVLRRRTAI